MKIDSAGLIVNPTSGLGARRNLQLARQAIEGLGIRHVLTGPGQLGGDAVPWADVVAPPELSGRAVSQWIAKAIARANVDALAVIGGDGTLADVAFALMEAERRPPILGIGAGSTNAGDLVTCPAGDVESGALESAEFAVQGVDALIAGCNGRGLALAFNDVVIGTTIVGTLDGEVCDLDAAEHLNGVRMVGRPQVVGGHDASVIKVFPGGTVRVASGWQVGTVIAGFAHTDRFYGKAIVGGVCLTSLAGLPAGCLVCDQVLVRTRLDILELAAGEPVRSAYASLAETDSIEVSGIGPPAVLCADGNPLKALVPDDRVGIRVLREPVCVLRMVKR